MSESTEEHQDEQADDSDVDEQKKAMRHEDDAPEDDSGEESEVEEQKKRVI